MVRVGARNRPLHTKQGPECFKTRGALQQPVRISELAGISNLSLVQEQYMHC
jgi:hypothetical protein